MPLALREGSDTGEALRLQRQKRVPEAVRTVGPAADISTEYKPGLYSVGHFVEIMRIEPASSCNPEIHSPEMNLRVTSN